MEPLWKMKNFKSIEDFLAYEGIVGEVSEEKDQSVETEQEKQDKTVDSGLNNENPL